jgi:hypothetical protein
MFGEFLGWLVVTKPAVQFSDIIKNDRACHYERNTISELGRKREGTYMVSLLLEPQNLLPAVCDWCVTFIWGFL